MHQALRENNSELTVALLRKGADPRVETEGGQTAVIRAALASDRSFLRMVVEAGADVNAYSQVTGLSALCWSCRRGDLPTVSHILATPGVGRSVGTGWVGGGSRAEAGPGECGLRR